MTTTPRAIALEARAARAGGFTFGARRAALDMWASARAAQGLRARSDAPLITMPGDNPKMAGEWSITLAAGRASGMCVNDAACVDTCVVDKSFHGTQTNVKASRAARTALLEEDPASFLYIVRRDVESLIRARGPLAGRLNANSDVAYERVSPELLEWLDASGVMAYDYTKRVDRVGHVAKGYRTTYSATATTREATIRRIVSRGDTVTMVFPVRKGDGNMPRAWRDIPVVNGDYADNRAADPAGVIVGLSAKGGLAALIKSGQGSPLLSPLT